jgi:hypothetical protein
MTSRDAASRSFEGSCQSTATQEAVWAVWTNPASWVGGVIAKAQLDGSFDVGSKLTTRVRGFPASSTTITQIEPPARWVSVAKAPGLTLTFEHVVDEVRDGSALTERATLSGPLAGVASRLLGRRLAATFRATTAHCASLAEAR